MNKVFLISIGIAALFVCSMEFGASGSSDHTVQDEVSASPGQTLILDLDTGGDVLIRGWSKNAVAVKADLSGNDGCCEFQMDRISGGVRIQSTPRHQYRSQSYSTSFRFDLNVPENFNVELRSAGGDVKIVRLNGELRGSTGGGEIVIQDSKGRVNLATGGGEINIIRSHMNGEVSTGGGDIHFEDVSGDIDGSTGSGTVTRNQQSSKPSPYKFAEGRTSELRIEKAGGAIHVADAPNGIDAVTGGGEIRIGSAKYRVSAQTGGGDVRINSVDGEVEATTGAGDMSVEMISNLNSASHDVDLSSGTGDITLIVPPSFSMQLDLKIGDSNEAKGSYDIISDFPFQKTSTAKWSDAEGTPRKYIYGKGNIGGGKNRIRISTVNGNIFLRRG